MLLCAGCDSVSDTSPGAASNTATLTAPTASPPDFFSEAVRAISSNDNPAAEAALRNHMMVAPNDPRALEMSGDLAGAKDDFSTSITMYQAAIHASGQPDKKLYDKLVGTVMRSTRPFDAMDILDQAIAAFPNHIQWRFDLAGIASMMGVPRRSLESLQWLSQHNQGDPESLVVLAETGRVLPDTEMCEKLLEKFPDDPRPRYAVALLASRKLEWQSAAADLESLLKKHPNFKPAYLLYGFTLVELDRYEEIIQWQKAAPPGIESEPEYWIVAGLWALHSRRHEEAARAFWEAIRIDEYTYPDALQNLLISLNALQRTADVEAVSMQITKHSTMRDSLKTHIERKSESQQAAMRVADAMLDLGRIWEAEGWARLALSLPKDKMKDARERYVAIRKQLNVNTPWVLPSELIAKKLDLQSYPLVDWVPSDQSEISQAALKHGDLYFEDEAVLRNWIHTCEVSEKAKTEGHWIFHAVGGGVGTIDFDLDGWPDLAAAMLDGKPMKTDSSPNELYRNLDGRFVACGISAGYRDTGFGQGITVADYNDDGFSDIYDANIGKNGLYRNNGDGTFSDVSAAAGLAGLFWTTSVAIGDIDGDGNADMFETAYAAGNKPYEKECSNSHGVGTCPPLNFDAQPDRVWQGVGDGTFKDMTSQWMTQSTPGRGLGIVLGKIDERPGMDLYIANDMSVNHLWSVGGKPGKMKLDEMGAVRGLGFDARSISQASMGIANGDPDGDGDIDFFVTHFAKDHNTFYEQIAPGIWADRSYQVNLSEPSMPLLGFGTQWCDFDNNSDLELIIANGHVDRNSTKGALFRMPPQMFRITPTGSWVEIDRPSLGDYFTSEHLGRALATLDINNDGLMDVAITHLFDPVSMLVNHSKQCGRVVALELKSTSGQRDAIGTIVTANVGKRKITKQLTGGDGYMCTNQRRLDFGIGDQDQLMDVVVTWPSGEIQSLGNLGGNAVYVVVENDPNAFVVHQYGETSE